MSDQPMITDEEYAMVSGLAARQVMLEKEIVQMVEALDAKKKELDQVRDKELPNAMMEIGIEEVKLKSGHKISIKNEAYCSISAEKAPAAHAWLRDHGHGAIIKNVIFAEFGKGEDERAIEAATALAEAGFKPEQKETVHPQTLKAFIREQINKGEEVPLDLFGAYIVNRAKVEKK